MREYAEKTYANISGLTDGKLDLSALLDKFENKDAAYFASWIAETLEEMKWLESEGKCKRPIFELNPLIGIRDGRYDKYGVSQESKATADTVLKDIVQYRGTFQFGHFWSTMDAVKEGTVDATKIKEERFFGGTSYEQAKNTYADVLYNKFDLENSTFTAIKAQSTPNQAI